MLESGDVLRTWALAELPVATGDAVEAKQLADHRLAYLEYEGPISGGRGTVSRADAGTFETVVEASDGWEFRFSGRMLRGRCRLRHVGQDQWTLTIESID
jgi:hypothetical protein